MCNNFLDRISVRSVYVRVPSSSFWEQNFHKFHCVNLCHVWDRQQQLKVSSRNAACAARGAEVRRRVKKSTSSSPLTKFLQRCASAFARVRGCSIPGSLFLISEHQSSTRAVSRNHNRVTHKRRFHNPPHATTEHVMTVVGTLGLPYC